MGLCKRSWNASWHARPIFTLPGVKTRGSRAKILIAAPNIRTRKSGISNGTRSQLTERETASLIESVVCHGLIQPRLPGLVYGRGQYNPAQLSATFHYDSVILARPDRVGKSIAEPALLGCILGMAISNYRPTDRRHGMVLLSLQGFKPVKLCRAHVFVSSTG